MGKRKMENIIYMVLSVLIYFISEEIITNIIFKIYKFKGYKLEEISDLFYKNQYKIDILCLGIILFFLLILLVARSREVRWEHRVEYLSFDYIEVKDVFDSTILLMGVKGVIELWFMILDYLALNNEFIARALYNFQIGAGSNKYVEPYLYVVVAVVVLGPIVEEIIFRGVIFKESSLFLNEAFAIIFSSVAFGLFHGDIIQISYTILMGILLSYLYKRYKNLLLPIYLHMLSNMLEILPIESYVMDIIQELVTMVYIICVVFSIKILFRFRRQDERNIFMK